MIAYASATTPARLSFLTSLGEAWISFVLIAAIRISVASSSWVLLMGAAPLVGDDALRVTGKGSAPAFSGGAA